MKKILFSLMLSSLLLVSLLLNSCSKEQQTLNKLAGDWKYTKVSFLGATIDLATVGYSNATLHFDDCKASNAACTGVQNLSGVASNFTYTLSEDAKVVSVLNTSGVSNTYTIVKIDKNNLSYSTIIGGYQYEFFLVK